MNPYAANVDEHRAILFFENNEQAKDFVNKLFLSSEADQRDAARYRWLRDVASKFEEPWGLYRPKMTYRLDEDCYDSSIDAAMSARNDTEER